MLTIRFHSLPKKSEFIQPDLAIDSEMEALRKDVDQLKKDNARILRILAEISVGLSDSKSAGEFERELEAPEASKKRKANETMRTTTNY